MQKFFLKNNYSEFPYRVIFLQCVEAHAAFFVD